MNETFMFCDNCGAKCDINDTYCKACSHSLLKSNCLDQPIIDGIENSKLKNFIGKNSDFYVRKFAKSNKKWFIGFNFAALFFGPTWFFFRKMYKVAWIYFATAILVFAFFHTIIPVIFKADIDKFFAAESAYQDYIDSGKEKYTEPGVKFDYAPEFKPIIEDLKATQKKMRLVSLFIAIPPLILNIFMGLLGNSFYKNYVTSSINNDYAGGTSIKNAIFGHILLDVALSVISFLLLMIPVVFEFNVASSLFRSWLY